VKNQFLLIVTEIKRIHNSDVIFQLTPGIIAGIKDFIRAVVVDYSLYLLLRGKA
jgi:hypothetical protein